MTRIQLQDTTFDVVAKMAEGNPGAISAITDIMNVAEKVDPQAFMGGLGVVLSMDTLKIYGPRIWMLYKDVCGQSANKTIGLLRANQLGLLSERDLNHAIDNYGAGIDLDGLLQQVTERLEQFNLEYSPAA